MRGTSWRVWIETLGVEEGPHAGVLAHHQCHLWNQDLHLYLWNLLEEIVKSWNLEVHITIPQKNTNDWKRVSGISSFLSNHRSIHFTSRVCRGWCIKFATGLNGRFTTISSYFVDKYLVIFHKTDVQTVILRCWTGLYLIWFKSYATNTKNEKKPKQVQKA